MRIKDIMVFLSNYKVQNTWAEGLVERIVSIIAGD
jgi:hypothetical protein